MSPRARTMMLAIILALASSSHALQLPHFALSGVAQPLWRLRGGSGNVASTDAISSSSTDDGALGEKAAVRSNSSTVEAAPPMRNQPSILRKAARRALGGGLGGLLAGVVQVLLLMWLRTVMNYQYRYGTSTVQAMKTLYAQGGIPRFYKGVGWALVQTPLTRFGDTAANSGMLELLSVTSLPISVRTAVAGLAAAMWRMALTPVDTLKTTLQVEGSQAYSLLMDKVAKHGVGTLYAGCAATWLASFVGGYPWFTTFNTLDARLPKAPGDRMALKLSRSAFMGVCATTVSDCVANSLRVLKTTRQTSATPIGYLEAVRLVVASDGWIGLFARGLGTRLLTNAMQASLFTIVWKLVEESLTARQAAADEAAKEA